MGLRSKILSAPPFFQKGLAKNIDYDMINECISNGGGYAYDSLMYGNRPYIKITNHLTPTGPKVVIIRDSFSNAVAPYLALSCSELILLDTRPTHGNFNGSVVNLINNYNPDIVIILQHDVKELNLNEP